MIKIEQDEEIVLVVRKHWFVFVVHSLVSLFFAILPAIVFLVFTVLTGIVIPQNIFWIIVFGYSLWLLTVWTLYFIQWTDYYLDVWYVTNEKIYDVLQKGFFNRQVSILRFDRIQDITVSVNGLIATLLDFGTIHVQTAGESSVDFTLKDASHPTKVKQVISDLHEKSQYRS